MDSPLDDRNTDMEPNPVVDSILASLALTSTILVLGAVFLLVLRGPRFQYSLRFLILSIGCLAVVIGLWTALLRSDSRPGLTGPGMGVDTPQAEPELPIELEPADR